MAADPVRSEPGAPAGGPRGDATGDVVLSIDAMGGDRGMAAVIQGMGKSLQKNTRLRFILHGNAEEIRRRFAPAASSRPGPRCATPMA